MLMLLRSQSRAGHRGIINQDNKSKEEKKNTMDGPSL
jgi:hypothetical protein